MSEKSAAGVHGAVAVAKYDNNKRKAAEGLDSDSFIHSLREFTTQKRSRL